MQYDIPEALLRKLYYEEGLTQEEIAARLGCSPSTIVNRMRACGMETRVNSDYLYIELPRDELYALYVEQGHSAERIAAMYGVSRETVLRRLRDCDIPVRLNYTMAQHVPPEAYTKWSPELAWAVGLFASDGCLPKNKNLIELTSTESELMEQFAACIWLDPKVEPYYRQACGNRKAQYRFSFSDAGFRRFLLDIGLTPCKSLTLGPLAIPDEVFADFARGAWDGDGSWVARHRPYAPTHKVYHSLTSKLCSASPIYREWMRGKIEQLTGLRGSISGITLVYYEANAVALGRWMYYALDLPHLSYKRAVWAQFL